MSPRKTMDAQRVETRLPPLEAALLASYAEAHRVAIRGGERPLMQAEALRQLVTTHAPRVIRRRGYVVPGAVEVGDLVCGGAPRSEDYDQGTVSEVDPEHPSEVLVAWEGAATTDWAPVAGLRRGHEDAWSTEEDA